MVPLIMAPREQMLTIEKVSGNAKIKKHFSDLGFVPGAEIVVLSELAGNLIVNVKQCRIAIGKDMATKVKVNICCEERGKDDADFKIYKGRQHCEGCEATRGRSSAQEAHGHGNNKGNGNLCEKSCAAR